MKLSTIPQVREVPELSSDATTFLEDFVSSFSVHDALAVKKVEKVTNHDVKAVEYVLKERLSSHPELAKV